MDQVIRQNSVIILLFFIGLLELVNCNKHYGQFFASSDQEKTLVYLNHTLFIEKLDLRSHRHIQYKIDPFRFEHEDLNPASGIIYGDLSIISKDMNIYIHKINYIKQSLDFIQKVDLKVICPNLLNDTLSQEYCIDNDQNDFITNIHIYFNILVINTNSNTYIINIDEIQIKNTSHNSINNTSFTNDQLISSLISKKKYQVISGYDYDRFMEGYVFSIKQNEFIVFQSKLSPNNQIIIQYNMTGQFFDYIKECNKYLDFDMVYEQNSPKIEKGYFIMIRCDQKLSLLKLTNETMKTIYQDANVPLTIDSSYRSIYLLDSYDQHIYAFYSTSQVCFYSNSIQQNSKFLNEKQNQNSTEIQQIQERPHRLCINNHMPGVNISHVLYNELDSKVTLILSHTEQNTDILGQLIDKCRLINMKESITCDICTACSNSCYHQLLDQCGNTFMMMRFNLIIVLMCILIIILVAYVVKCIITQIKEFFLCFGDFFILIFCRFPCILKNIIKKLYRHIRINCRRLKIKIRTVSHKLFRKKGKLNDETEDICPICMEELSARPVSKFVCQNHQAHIDCLEEYNYSKTSNNQPLDCPFRDTVKNAQPNQNIELSNQSEDS